MRFHREFPDGSSTTVNVLNRLHLIYFVNMGRQRTLGTMLVSGIISLFSVLLVLGRISGAPVREIVPTLIG